MKELTHEDSFRACIASILEIDKMDDIPKFRNPWFKTFLDWCNYKDYSVIFFNNDSEVTPALFVNTYCILGYGVKDKPDTLHAIIGASKLLPIHNNEWHSEIKICYDPFPIGEELGDLEWFLFLNKKNQK